MAKPTIIIFSLSILHITASFFLQRAQATNNNILSFGAKPDGRTDSTKALLSAWSSACGSTSSSILYIPKGTYLIGKIVFNGPCKNTKITIRIEGTLLAPSNYNSLGRQWIVFNNVDGVSILGGTLDGQGASLWACKASSDRRCPFGTTSLEFAKSKNIVISGVTSMNSKLYHIVIHQCKGVKVQGVRIMAPGDSPNTDGVHVQLSSDVIITGTGIKTGDDCVSIGPGTTNLWIERVTCGPGHGISIGSLGKDYDEQGVQNVTVKTVTFSGTQNGLRIKTWGRPSDGYVRGIHFENAIMNNVQNPIIINQNYCPDHKGCPNQSSGIKISGVTYSDIRGSSTTPVAVDFDCSPSSPCRGISLQDIKLTYGSGQAKSSCKHVDGSTSGFVFPPSCL